MHYLTGILLPLLASSQLPPDTLYDSLKASAVQAEQNLSVIRAQSDRVQLETEQLRTFPMILGSADPVRFSQYLPSMSATTELDASLHIQGNDHSHNLVSIGGIPIYGASHLLGLFSVFNPTHFPRMDYSTWTADANRLGGQLDMALPPAQATKVGADVSVGLVSAQGTLTLPLGKSTLTASVRRSYLNLLYGSFLQMNGNRFKYGFTDANLTWLWEPRPQDRIWVDAYYGDDSVVIPPGNLGLVGDFRWWNAMGAVHWHHRTGEGLLRQRVWMSAYSLNLDVVYASMTARAPSTIMSEGYRLSYEWGPWKTGIELQAHQARPQALSLEGTFNDKGTQSSLQQGQELTVFGRYARSWGPFGLDLGLKGILWHGADKKLYPAAGPEAIFSWDFYRGGKLELQAGLHHQYLMQAGITDMGLPLEFWFLAGAYNKPQQSLGASLRYQLSFLNDRYRLTTDLYYRNLKNQAEYASNLVDFLFSPYSLESAIQVCDGRAYGLNLMLQKQSGALTGWISYAWGRSLRRFGGADAPERPSNHERIHELDLVAMYQLGRWNFGATFVAASGTPYTPVNSVLIINNHVIAIHGEKNSARLAPYMRLDLSVSYFFHRDARQENGLNFSLYNALGRNNEFAHHLVVNMQEETFAYRPAVVGVRFLPSLCYFHKF